MNLGRSSNLLLLLFDPSAAFMLSTQLNFMAEENVLAPNCICILKKHVTNILKDKRYADVLENTFCHLYGFVSMIVSTIIFQLSNAIFSHYRRVVVILEIEVIKPAQMVDGRIGDPIALTEGKQSNYYYYNIWYLINTSCHEGLVSQCIYEVKRLCTFGLVLKTHKCR